jgi:cytoskeletal protein CcmA (bactofilin family)
MMKNLEKTGELSTIIGRGSFVQGDLKVDHSLRIDGKVKGDVTSVDTLIVGAEGEISGNVTVKNLILGGKVFGSVVAPGRTVLESKSEFHGDLKTAKLTIDEGAIFDGKCSMSESGKAGEARRKESSAKDEDAIIK